MIESCVFCERKCRANRLHERGFCGVSYDARVSSAFIHMGEESMLIPSGTIFFSGCNFRCCFCQNYDISQNPSAGRVWTAEEIASWIENIKAKNINLVGGEPTPNLHIILDALALCKRNIPIIWNSNMYMSLEAMELLNGIVDLYLADFKYGNSKCAERLSSAPNYFEIVSRNHLIAQEQCDVLIRHLVLPGHLECCSRPTLRWIVENMDPEKTHVNIMRQYRPVYKAHMHKEIDRLLSGDEYWSVVEYAERLGLENYEIQGL
ncbi:MAG: radical SAM protein [Candidatus Micrarchaeia archaeon]